MKAICKSFCYFQGQCERTMQDVVERIWDFIDDFNINSVLKFLKDNIVGTVVVISLIFWVPISCLISYVDKKRASKVRQFVDFIYRLNFHFCLVCHSCRFCWSLLILSTYFNFVNFVDLTFCRTSTFVDLAWLKAIFFVEKVNSVDLFLLIFLISSINTGRGRMGMASPRRTDSPSGSTPYHSRKSPSKI